VRAPFATSSSTTNGDYKINFVNLENIHQKRKDGNGALLFYLKPSTNITIKNYFLIIY